FSQGAGVFGAGPADAIGGISQSAQKGRPGGFPDTHTDFMSVHPFRGKFSATQDTPEESIVTSMVPREPPGLENHYSIAAGFSRNVSARVALEWTAFNAASKAFQSGSVVSAPPLNRRARAASAVE